MNIYLYIYIKSSSVLTLMDIVQTLICLCCIASIDIDLHLNNTPLLRLGFTIAQPDIWIPI